MVIKVIIIVIIIYSVLAIIRLKLTIIIIKVVITMHFINFHALIMAILAAITKRVVIIIQDYFSQTFLIVYCC